MNAVIRSWLYVPADRPDRIAKALSGEADAVVLDLEDSIAQSEKESARRTALETIAEKTAKPTLIRINAPDSPLGEADLRALETAGHAGLAGVRIPKCEDPDLVRRIADRLGVAVHPLVETALGVERAFELATAHPLVGGLSLGEADLAADLHCEPAGLSWARSRTVVAARAAGLPSPPQSVWTDLRDTAGLRASTADGRRAGFFGRSVIHPSQLAEVHGAYAPSEDEVRAARELVRQLESGGDATWVDGDGRFVDNAVVRRARQVLENSLAKGQ